LIPNKERKIVIPQLSKITAFVLGVLILILTLLRENLFLEINAIMDGYIYNKAYFYFLNEKMSSLTYSQLGKLKWSLTIAFILVISGITLLIIQLWFKNKRWNRITWLFYLVFYGLTGLITLLLWLTGTFSTYYFILRKMIGFLQSPLPLFFFFTLYLYLINTRVNP